MIPQFFSKRGRTAIVAYTFFIAFNGPAANLMKNFHVLSDCLACGQDQLKLALHELIHAVKEPFYTIKEAVEKIIPLIKNVMENVKQSVVELKVHIVRIGKYINFQCKIHDPNLTLFKSILSKVLSRGLKTLLMFAMERKERHSKSVSSLLKHQ